MLKINFSKIHRPLPGLSPYRGDDVPRPNDTESYTGGSISSWYNPPLPSRSKGKGQTKPSPWSSRLGVGRVANKSTPEKSTIAKTPEPMVEGCRGGQNPHRVVAPIKEMNKKKINLKYYRLVSRLLIIRRGLFPRGFTTGTMYLICHGEL
jgi:hypothetical protein